MLRELKMGIDSDAPGLQTICPTRWTVRAYSFASKVENDDNIQLQWETAIRATSDTEMQAIIHGMKSQMSCFKFLFCLILSDMILSHNDKLSQTLQEHKMEY